MRRELKEAFRFYDKEGKMNTVAKVVTEISFHSFTYRSRLPLHRDFEGDPAGARAQVERGAADGDRGGGG